MRTSVRQSGAYRYILFNCCAQMWGWTGHAASGVCATKTATLNCSCITFPLCCQSLIDTCLTPAMYMHGAQLMLCCMRVDRCLPHAYARMCVCAPRLQCTWVLPACLRADRVRPACLCAGMCQAQSNFLLQLSTAPTWKGPQLRQPLLKVCQQLVCIQLMCLAWCCYTTGCVQVGHACCC